MDNMINADHRRRAGSRSRRYYRAGGCPQGEYQHSHAVLPEGHQRNRRLPYVRGGNRRAARLQAACVLPGCRRAWTSRPIPPQLRKHRRTTAGAAALHPRQASACPASAISNCELQELCRDLGVEDETAFAGSVNKYAIDDASPCMVRNNNKCVLCRRCVAACHQQQNVGVIGAGWPRLQDADRLSLGFRAGADRLRQAAVSASWPAPWARCRRRTAPKAVDDLLASDQARGTCRPLPPCAPRWAKSSACPWARTVDRQDGGRAAPPGL